jgi:ribonuclease VapC
MIVDTSALVAILKNEPGWEAFAKKLDSSRDTKISASTWVELCMVVDRLKDPATSLRVEELLQQFDIAVEPFTAEQARLARQAWRDFGKGSGHPAQLNFGDCFSYALARDRREPILYKGDDFRHTGLRSALDGQ